ncbi:hypothetical protein IX308_000147 [Porphyromonas levii]|nr:hypothetical protein [Porphyromonas levii]MBR8783989.1 hypothetical protein [Porphyromonas levii]
MSTYGQPTNTDIFVKTIEWIVKKIIERKRNGKK